MTPFVQTLLGMGLGSLLSFLCGYLLSRVTKRQDRRIDWYDGMERKVNDLGEAARRQADHLADLTTQLKDLRPLAGRVETLEWKIGSWYRLVEEKMTELFRQPR